MRPEAEASGYLFVLVLRRVPRWLKPYCWGGFYGTGEPVPLTKAIVAGSYGAKASISIRRKVVGWMGFVRTRRSCWVWIGGKVILFSPLAKGCLGVWVWVGMSCQVLLV